MPLSASPWWCEPLASAAVVETKPIHSPWLPASSGAPNTASTTDLRFAAGLMSRGGLDRDAALRAITLSAAEVLGVADRVGSLEPGKDADFIVLSGDPLSAYTHVEQTWVEGLKVFDRADPKDHVFAVGGKGAGDPQGFDGCCFGGEEDP